MENDSASLFPLIINSWLKIIRFYIIVTKLEQIIKIISAFERLFCLEFLTLSWYINYVSKNVGNKNFGLILIYFFIIYENFSGFIPTCK